MIAADSQRKAIRRRLRRALTIVETTISLVLTSVIIVSALGAVGTSQRLQSSADDRAVALTLAEELMDEILPLAYEDPADTPILFGIEAGEDPALRSTFDDVDDYDGWNSSPPQDPDGNALPGVDAYRRRVQIKWLDPADLTRAEVSETGIKRVRVRVKRDGKVLVTLYAICTAAWGEEVGGVEKRR